MYDIIGLPYDLDEKGDVAKIQSWYEAFQQAKSLTKDYQRNIRLQVIKKTLEKNR